MKANWRSSEHDPENCPDCRPVVFRTDGKPADVELAKAQAAADLAWRDALPDIRRAWHRVTCLNSRDENDMRQARWIILRMKQLSEQ